MIKNDTTVLHCLATIWKSGGKIKKDSNGDFELTDYDKVPKTCLTVAQTITKELDLYYQSVEDMSAHDQLIWRMMNYFQGWQTDNTKIREFFVNDEIGFNTFNDYMVKLAQNGWKDRYTDYRLFENAESDELKQILIKRVIEFGKSN